MTNHTYSRPALPEIEPLVTFKVAAQQLGLPYHRIQRAAKAGLIPTYKLGQSRKLVRVSEINAIINSTRTGGPQ